MSKIFEINNHKLHHTELEHEFGTFDDFDIKLTADTKGFELTIRDKGWSGQSLTFRMDVSLQDGYWELEAENNE